MPSLLTNGAYDEDRSREKGKATRMVPPWRPSEKNQFHGPAGKVVADL